jgi:hypothetical protein
LFQHEAIHALLAKIGICDFLRALTLQHSESRSLWQRSPESRDWHLKRGSLRRRIKSANPYAIEISL